MRTIRLLSQGVPVGTVSQTERVITMSEAFFQVRVPIVALEPSVAPACSRRRPERS